MGKAIVASNLDQIGEVLRHGETAWMVPPGDIDALADGLASLVQDRQPAGEPWRARRVARCSRITPGVSTCKAILDALEVRARDQVA